MVSTSFLSATVAVPLYYLIAWILVGRDPKPGAIMPMYEPPSGISPAMLRYIWKEVFDDRVLWSIMLSLVSRDLVKIQTKDSEVVLRATAGTDTATNLPKEEDMLLKLLVHHKGRGIAVPMMDGDAAELVIKIGGLLRKASAGKWFNDNREYVTAGSVLSVLSLWVAAMPQRLDQVFVLIVSLALMAPGSFYLLLLVLRLRDLLRAAHHKLEMPVLRRMALLVAFLTCCVASIVMGCVVLGGTFGSQLLALGLFFAALDLVFLHLMKAPTKAGRTLLDEIEGFRLFLKSVEKLPMDRAESPTQHAGAYEKYLPYAVALEVEQAWCDRFVSLASCFHHPEPLVGAESLYLGMWNGKPVQVVYKAEPVRRGSHY
jgi:hypothetical protein